MRLLVNAQLHTIEYRDDHSAEVIEVLNCPQGTTVEQLAVNLVRTETGIGQILRKYDWIEIRATEIKEQLAPKHSGLEAAEKEATESLNALVSWLEHTPGCLAREGFDDDCSCGGSKALARHEQVIIHNHAELTTARERNNELARTCGEMVAEIARLGEQLAELKKENAELRERVDRLLENEE